MAGSLNKVLLIGNLGADPEVRRTNSGDPIVNLRIATTESWRDKNSGERKSKTEWHTVVIFGGVAKVAEQYLKKGAKVYVEGQLQTRKWQDQSGNDRYSTEIVIQNFNGTMTMLSNTNDDGGDSRGGDSGRSERSNRSSRSSGSGGGSGQSRGNNDGGFGGGLDDEIPF